MATAARCVHRPPRLVKIVKGATAAASMSPSARGGRRGKIPRFTEDFSHRSGSSRLFPPFILLIYGPFFLSSTPVRPLEREATRSLQSKLQARRIISTVYAGGRAARAIYTGFMAAAAT